MLRYSFILFFLLVMSCANTQLKSTNPQMIAYEVSQPSSIGKKPDGTPIKLGGFSGLIYEGMDPESGEDIFLTLTDRGPNGPTPKKKGMGPSMTFLLPTYQLRWVRLGLNKKNKTLRVLEEIKLTHNGRPLKGLPNLYLKDELPLDAFGKKLTPDSYGLDPESIVKDNEGHYWVGEEYRPSLVQFNAKGELLARYVPYGVPSSVGIQVLPAIYSQRRLNRGFEALAFTQGKLYAFLQSPLDSDSKASRVIRILEFDPKLKRPTGEFFYHLDDGVSDRKIGDAIAISSNELLVIEQTSQVGQGAIKKIYRIKIKPGEKQVEKNLVLDLLEEGYGFVEKAEGIALMDSRIIAVLSDNDFGLFGEESSYLVLFPLKEKLK